MNVLVVSSKFPPEYAGSGLRAHATYRRLARDYGVRYAVLTSSVVENSCLVYEHEGAHVTRIARKLSRAHPGDPGDGRAPGRLRQLFASGVSRLDYLLEATAVWRLLRRAGPACDLFHVFGNNHVTAAALTYAKAVGKPCMVELVNLTDDPRQYEPWALARLLGPGLPRSAQLVCISPRLAAVCRDLGYAEERIWCRPNPVDETRFHYDPDRRRFREAVWPGLAPDDVLLVYLAKFRRLKNQRFLLDVLALLPPRHKLVLAGPLVADGPLARAQQAYFREIETATQALGLADRVSLRPGFVARPEELLMAADVSLMPSTNEALGTPVLEAVACGAPCVANDIPGVFDRWLREGENGAIRPLDPAAWAEAIRLAAAIPPAAMARASAALLAEAGATVVDRQYMERLTALAGRASG